VLRRINAIGVASQWSNEHAKVWWQAKLPQFAKAFQ
jgi:hypothetical protein